MPLLHLIRLTCARNEGWVHRRTRLGSWAIGQRLVPTRMRRSGLSATLHLFQRNWDGLKGLYHLSALEAVTQG